MQYAGFHTAAGYITDTGKLTPKNYSNLLLLNMRFYLVSHNTVDVTVQQKKLFVRNRIKVIVFIKVFRLQVVRLNATAFTLTDITVVVLGVV